LNWQKIADCWSSLSNTSIYKIQGFILITAILLICAACLNAFRRYSNYTVGQFTDFNHESDRNTIDPERLRDQLADKMLDEQLLDSEAWEFKVAPEATIPPRSLWRAHGLRIGNVFYVIWLDPKHKLFESKHPKHKKISGQG